MVAAVGVEQPSPHRHAQQRIAAAVSAVPICAAEVPAAATVWLPHVVDVYEPLPGQACLTASAVLAHQHRVDVHAFAQLRPRPGYRWLLNTHKGTAKGKAAS